MAEIGAGKVVPLEIGARQVAAAALLHASGDELVVALAAAFRLAVGQVTLAMVLCGWPVWMRIVLQARTITGLEPAGRNIITGRVHDNALGRIVPLGDLGRAAELQPHRAHPHGHPASSPAAARRVAASRTAPTAGGGAQPVSRPA